jgi:hypothetical protein
VNGPRVGVDEVKVTATRFQVPVVEQVTARGRWERLIPSTEHALATVEVPALAQICWLDMKSNPWTRFPRVLTTVYELMRVE